MQKKILLIPILFPENVPPKLVNSCDKILVADPFPEKLPEKRTSSGLGDSSIDSSNPELGQAHHMFSRFLNLRIYEFSLFCFSTR